LYDNYTLTKLDVGYNKIKDDLKNEIEELLKPENRERVRQCAQQLGPTSSTGSVGKRKILLQKLKRMASKEKIEKSTDSISRGSISENRGSIVENDSRRGSIVENDSRRGSIVENDSRRGSIVEKDSSRRGSIVENDSRRGSIVENDSRRGSIVDQDKRGSISDGKRTPEKDKKVGSLGRSSFQMLKEDFLRKSRTVSFDLRRTSSSTDVQAEVLTSIVESLQFQVKEGRQALEAERETSSKLRAELQQCQKENEELLKQVFIWRFYWKFYRRYNGKVRQSKGYKGS
jgi:hypothetical protein